MSTCNPTPPPGFPTIVPENPDGFYVFGFPDFRVRPLRIANIFHRSFAGRHEDFVLGVLSVMLIAVLTEIFQVVLMRTWRQKVTRSGFNTAFVLDELTHFRNVFAHLRHRKRSTVTRSVMWSSLTILSIGAALIAAEVFAVYLTQPFRVYAPPHRYNLRGIQPVQTTDNVSSVVDKITEKNRCVSPMMPDSNQSRQFTIIACVNRSTDDTLNDITSTATFVEIGSWFHKAGSDHYITYGNPDAQGTHTISIRASIMQSELGVNTAIMFDFNQSTIVQFTKYVHARALQAAIERSCEGLIRGNCDSLLAQCSIDSTDVTQEKTITLWEVLNETGTEIPVQEEVQGVVTRFKIELSAPGLSLRHALRVFATSAAIEEVLDGQGKYVRLQNGNEFSAMERLVSEEGRIAGIVLLTTVVLIMFALLVLLRIVFKPISIARLAKDSFDAEDETYAEDDFGGSGHFTEPGGRDQSAWALERDIVEPDLEDYGSPYMFDMSRDPPPKRGFWGPHDRGPA